MKSLSARVYQMAPLLLSMGLAYAAPMTLGDAQQWLFQNNPDLQSASIDITRAQIGLSESRSAYWPSLDASANYSATSPTSHLDLDLPFPPPQGTQVSKDLGDHDRWETGLDLTYPLFNGFSRERQVEARRHSLEAQKSRLQGQRNSASMKLAALYFAWQAASASLDYQDAQCRFGEAALSVAEEQKKQGLNSDRAALAARSRLLANQSDRIAAANQIDSLQWEAGQLLNSPGEWIWSQDTVTEELPDSLSQEGLAEKTSERPELMALSRQGQALQATEAALKGQNWPTVGAMAGLRYANPGMNLAGTEPMGYALAGLQLKWNLLDGGRQRSQSADLRQRELQLNLESAKLKAEWRKGYSLAARQYRRWRNQAQSSQAALESAERSLFDSRKLMSQGMGTALDTLETKAQAERARMSRKQSLAMQKLAYCQWRFARGDTLNFSR